MKSQTERAVVRRINRKLESTGKSGRWMEIRKARGERMKVDVGGYYMVEKYHDLIQEKDVNIKTLAKELGVL
ncbi:MAG: hypothetical protein ACLPH5_04605 [Candidatus Sulfotelmatobacter sp.]